MRAKKLVLVALLAFIPLLLPVANAAANVPTSQYRGAQHRARPGCVRARHELRRVYDYRLTGY